MWERTLQDLIRGLRANKNDEAKFISKAVDEIRREIKTDDMEKKSGAVLKLTYLGMLGYDMSWASFYVVEVMSSPKLHLKSVGYLAAAQSFEQDTDVLMLTTNLIKKDMSSTPADVGIALNGLAHIVAPDLARDVSPELIRMLNHSRPHIRKRAVLALYKVLSKYPEAMSHARPRLEEKLQDDDASVIAATVNVLCELARKNPQDYLELAPQLFHLLTSSSNNWMLIKIIKLFGCLSPHEPRLVKKLQPPITEIISTTHAISLLYECVHTCIIGGMLRGSSGDSLANTCISKLAAFIEDPDQNLKYIALLAMAKIAPTHPYLIADYQETILASVNDQDISIRMRALDLVSAMVNRDNIQSIIQQVLSYLASSKYTLYTAAQSLAHHVNATSVESNKSSLSPSQSSAYRLVLSERILDICSRSTYENITNFEWYLSVLVDLTHISKVNIGNKVKDQLVDIVGRVRGVQRFAVDIMYTLLRERAMLRDAGDEGSCSQVLWAAGWICGEHCSELSEPQTALAFLLQPEVVNLEPGTIAVYIQAAIKIFGFWANEIAKRWTDDDLPDVIRIAEILISRSKDLSRSPHVEVQERAANAVQLFTFILADLNSYRLQSRETPGVLFSQFLQSTEPHCPKSLYLIHPLFATCDLNPVSRNAQDSVPMPEGLDLDAWIVRPLHDAGIYVDEINSKKPMKGKEGKGKEINPTKVKSVKKKIPLKSTLISLESKEEIMEQKREREKRQAERRAQLHDDPYYIIDNRPALNVLEDVDNIPIVKLEGIMPSLNHDMEDHRLSTLRSVSHAPLLTPYIVEREGEMPENAMASGSRPQLSGSLECKAITTLSTSSVSAYGIVEDNNPEPIKVVRVKKKTYRKLAEA